MGLAVQAGYNELSLDNLACLHFSPELRLRVPQVREIGVPGKRSLLGWGANLSLHRGCLPSC